MTSEQAIILDTETHALDGLVIQLAHAPLKFIPHDDKFEPVINSAKIFNELYSIGDNRIDHAAMAVHNIIDSDIANKADCSAIQLPISEGYIIGHNIDYDVKAIERSTNTKIELKRICTLALARMAFPELKSHKLTALIYHIYGPTDFARILVLNSHDAATDIRNTAHLLCAICAHLRIYNIEDLYQASLKARIPKIMTFGKHQGLPIDQVPRPYMKWYLQTENADPYLCEAFNQVLNPQSPQNVN